MKKRRKIFIDTLKKCRDGFAVLFLTFVISYVIFYLYALPLEPFFYAYLMVFFVLAVRFFVIYADELSKSKTRESMIRSALAEAYLPKPRTQAEEDYTEVIGILREELTRLRNEFETQRQNDTDYYTAWVHQIKTPIAVMRMELGGRDDDSSRALDAELFRIEQYVDMVLTYIRLDSAENDLVIKEYPLDEIIRDSIRKFAPQFVSKRLRLTYDGTDDIIITDKKWFSSILDQIISNAIKYTPAGTGSITVSLDDCILTVSDTGIGIAPEDIPRIFDKGYTGENGRIEKRSSGLGLYLCKKAADLLQIPISVESTVGTGSRLMLDLRNKTNRSSH